MMRLFACLRACVCFNKVKKETKHICYSNELRLMYIHTVVRIQMRQGY